MQQKYNNLGPGKCLLVNASFCLNYSDYVHIERIGDFMSRLLTELASAYAGQPVYQVLEHAFHDHFRVEGEAVKTKANQELSATSLQSPDDLEATYRQKGGTSYHDYVANLSETCDPHNPLQLITKVQVAPNATDDSRLLADDLPNLKQRTELEAIYTDGGHGGLEADAELQKQQVTYIQTAIRGRSPNPRKFNLSDFEIKLTEAGKPTQITCPSKQQVPVQPGSQNKGCVAHFDQGICQACPFWQTDQCPARPRKRDERHHLRFTQAQAHASQRRRQSQAQKKERRNLRAAIEATVRCDKHPFPASKLSVRGSFRMACLLIGSAAMTNVRRIQHYLDAQIQSENFPQGPECSPEQQADSFFAFVSAVLMNWIGFLQPSKHYLGC